MGDSNEQLFPPTRRDKSRRQVEIARDLALPIWRLDVVVLRNRSWTILCRLYAAMGPLCTPVTTVMDSRYELKCVIFVLTFCTAIFTAWKPQNSPISQTTTCEYGIFSLSEFSRLTGKHLVCEYLWLQYDVWNFIWLGYTDIYLSCVLVSALLFMDESILGGYEGCKLLTGRWLHSSLCHFFFIHLWVKFRSLNWSSITTGLPWRDCTIFRITAYQQEK